MRRNNFGFATEQSVFSLERLRLHADEPLIYSVDVLPAEKLNPSEN